MIGRERDYCLQYGRTYANDLQRRRRSSTRPARRPRHGTLTDVRRNQRARRVLVEMDGRAVLLRTLRGMRQVLWRMRRTTRTRVGKMRKFEVKATTRRTMRPTPALLSHACPCVYPCLFSVAKKINFIYSNIFFGFCVDTYMFARLLVRWPRSSPVALHAHARAFRVSSLAPAPSAATLLKPRLPPATPAYEPPVAESTNRAHFSSTKFADAPISNSSKMAIPHEYASLHPSLFGRNCRCANGVSGT